MPELTPEFQVKNYDDVNTEGLIAYVSLSMARLAMDAKPEAKIMATESLEALEILKKRFNIELAKIALGEHNGNTSNN